MLLRQALEARGVAVKASSPPRRGRPPTRSKPMRDEDKPFVCYRSGIDDQDRAARRGRLAGVRLVDGCR